MKKVFKKRQQVKKNQIAKFKKFELKNAQKIVGGESGEEYAEDVDLGFNLIAY